MSYISSSFLVAVGHAKLVVGTFNHFTKWEALEVTNKTVLSRASREQGRIGKIWTRNMYENWRPYHITSYSTTWENLLVMICEIDIVMSVMINMPTWGRHTLNEGIILGGLDSMTTPWRITRKFDLRVWKRGCHRESQMIMKVVDFRKNDKLIPNGEGSFRIN